MRSRRYKICATALVLATSSVLASGQATFEVASIRQNTTLSTGGGGGPRPGGRYLVRNVTVRSLIGMAYGLPMNRVLSGPGWITTDRYDINAKTKENPTSEELQQMLQSLLMDRFRLFARSEKRDMPVYALVLSRRDGQLGPKMQRTTINCDDPKTRRTVVVGSSPERLACGFTVTEGTFVGSGIEIATLERILAGPAGRPVVDKTGLSGGYDIDLHWTALGVENSADDSISIFTAVQEQLGLKLEISTSPLDVIVVERVDRPTPD